MKRGGRIAGLLLLLLLIAGVKLGQQLYRWYAYADERSQIAGLRSEVEEAGLAVVRTQLRADSLRTAIEAIDRELEGAKRAVAAYDRHAVADALPAHLYDAYRSELAAYNRRVAERNARFDAWREVVERNHAAVGRYNRLADSIRAVALRMGEPYYPVPSPAELALRYGLTSSSARTAR